MSFFADELEKFGSRNAAIQSDGACITYGDLIGFSDKLSDYVCPRTLVFVLCSNSIGSIAGYVAFLRNRVVPVMLDSSIDKELFSNLVLKYRPAYIYMPSCENSLDMHDIQIAGYIYKIKNNEYDYSLFEINNGEKYDIYPELALMLTTSGSTGSPKFVRQSYENIESNTESICSYLGISENERPITTLPMYYTYGLSIIQTHLSKGATILVTDIPVIRKEFWEFAKKEMFTSISGVPYTYEILKKIKMTKMDLPSLKTMTQAGGKLPYDLHHEFAQYALSANKKFIVMYGQCEATARMGYLPAQFCLSKCGSIGITIPGGELSILDANEKCITAPDIDGELIYKGKNVTLGYAQNSDDLNKGDERHGILHTGDVARRDADGFYYITGRLSRFIKLFGSRVNLDEIDQLIIAEYPNIECASTGTDNGLITYINTETLVDDVKKYIISKTHINNSAVFVKYINKIPRSESGKVLYKELDSTI